MRYVFVAALALALCTDAVVAHKKLQSEMVMLQGGSVLIGTDDPEENAGVGSHPTRRVNVDPFEIDVTAVCNHQFRRFVRENKYKTEAELLGWSYAFADNVPLQAQKKDTVRVVEGAEWWMGINGAYWRQPGGPGTSLKDSLHHPVVHVSYKDAQAYCEWLGKRLPTEAEWEYAARGGEVGEVRPWPAGVGFKRPRMNIWEGSFPDQDRMRDGYHGTCPVTEYEPQNNYGMYNVLGNVWEWVSDEFEDDSGESKKVVRGGSYLDTHDGAANHRVTLATRMGLTPDSSADNVGFRCARTAQLTPTHDEL